MRERTGFHALRDQGIKTNENNPISSASTVAVMSCPSRAGQQAKLPKRRSEFSNSREHPLFFRSFNIRFCLSSYNLIQRNVRTEIRWITDMEEVGHFAARPGDRELTDYRPKGALRCRIDQLSQFDGKLSMPDLRGRPGQKYAPSADMPQTSKKLSQQA